MQNEKKEITKLIKAEAKRLGFSNCKISKIEPLQKEGQSYKKWILQSFNGEMSYLQNHIDKKLNPKLLVENSKTVISLSLNYLPHKNGFGANQYKISKYAWGRDYHKVLKKMMKKLYAYIQSLDSNIEGRYFVDSAPVLDKVWAIKSGIGWMGKNTNIINKDEGSFFFIGEIITNLELIADKPVSSYCGNCTKCIDACPTNAIIDAYIIDARKCISYQTIEKKGAIDEAIVPNLNNYIYGCDICQDVCPWNKKSPITEIDDFKSDKLWHHFKISDFQSLDKITFEKIFEGSPIKRAGYDKIMCTIQQISSYKASKD
jgi:epoxyqueuosine reductase